MTDLTPRPDAGNEGADSEPTRRTPRWAKIVGIVVVVLVALVGIMMLTRSGGFDFESIHRKFAGMHGG